MLEDILLKRNGSVATLVLNRPEKLNALSDNMMRGWQELLDELNADPTVSVVVVTGEGRGFCSGGDLKNRWHSGKIHRTPQDIRDHLEFTVHPLALAVSRFRKPYIAAVNGPAVGAGMDLASMADIRFASQSATFSSGYVNVGLIAADGGAYWLPRVVGMAAALDLMWTGRTIDAKTAKSMGYVTEVFDDGNLLPQVQSYAEFLASKGRLQLELTKELSVASQAMGLPESLKLARFAMSLIEGNDTAVDAAKAFAERSKIN